MQPEVQLVYDGRSVQIPSQCGEPAPGQMLGTPAEQLAELAGRECYDSLGKGRDSAAYHAHILEVGHLSVYEHFQFTVLVPSVLLDADRSLRIAFEHLANRPGLYSAVAGYDLRVTMNLRSVLEWSKWQMLSDGKIDGPPSSLLSLVAQLAPAVLRTLRPSSATTFDDLLSNARLVGPVDNEERWVTLRMTGSRGFSHELVRHGDRTAISQRSTRYVDENESPWCLHPLVRRLQQDSANAPWSRKVDALVELSRELYADTVALGSTELAARGVDRGTARKQSRGAARGFLGNALGTSLIFSASVAQWRRMLALRCHPAADAEIRESAVAVIEALRASCYFREFEDMVLVPSPDGLGEVLADGFKA